MAAARITAGSTPDDHIDETRFPDVKTTLNLFGIHRRTVGGDWSYPLHEHPQYEINYLLKGRQSMMVNGIAYEQQAGDLLLLRPGDVHASRSGDGEPFEYFCMHFDVDDRLFLSLLGRMEQVLFPASSAMTLKIMPVLHKMLEFASEADSRSVAFRMRLQSAVFELFGQLWDAISDETLQPAQSYGKVELAHEIASRLRSTASQTFSQEGTNEHRTGLREIAGGLGISVSYCNRVFSEVYGMPPRAYWSELLLHESKQLLADARYSIQAIAAILGYKDIAHFSRQFKRWTGLSPSDYRKGIERRDG
ncbi:AraC family transcriptional regulator [Paenibacillus rhizovicinus]|uniref:AraC family transcriptional regulator n=1 Tax=Paenibacillus rhizovicinus TaxID=2704463 RepID=A0A6C0NZ04_9BACL|nr:AraC family transcriptional regulator [Paenibacillus rhizovicinus]QHW30923.1 AraC family transcriptional regulator [Paenibacillus rhizovicinus]